MFRWSITFWQLVLKIHHSTCFTKTFKTVHWLCSAASDPLELMLAEFRLSFLEIYIYIQFHYDFLELWLVLYNLTFWSKRFLCPGCHYDFSWVFLLPLTCLMVTGGNTWFCQPICSSLEIQRWIKCSLTSRSLQFFQKHLLLIYFESTLI